MPPERRRGDLLLQVAGIGDHRPIAVPTIANIAKAEWNLTNSSWR